MDLSELKFRGARAFMALLTLTTGAGALHAANSLTATVSAGITCSVQTGPGTAATITVKAGTALVAPNTITVSVTAPGNGLTVTQTVAGAAGLTLNAGNNSTGVTFSVNSTNGCGGGSGAVITAVHFTGVGTAAVGAVTAGSVNVTDTVSSSFLLSAVVSGPVSCSTTTGPGTAATITITPFTALSGSNTIVVANVAAGGGLVLTPPGGGTTLSTSTTSLVYTVNAAPGCVGNTTGPTVIQFTAGGNNDVTASVSDTVTSSGSALVVTPSPITFRCIYSPSGSNPAANNSNYTLVGSAQTVSITSAATGGTPFTIDGTSIPSWLTVNSGSIAASATTTPTTFTVQPGAGCGNGGQTTHTVNIRLLSNPNVQIPVTVQNVFANPLTVTPVPAAANINLSYTKGSGNTASANVSVTSSVPSVFVTLNTATLPSWLTVDNISGTAPWSLRFSTTTVAASLAPGTYTASVSFQVSGYAPLSVPVSLQVNNTAPKLSVSANSVPLNWTLGAATPTYTVTATSTDSPIQYTITSGGTLAPTLVNSAQQSGLAYSFGTEIPVTFSSAAFATAQPGQVLTGTLTFTWGSPVSTTVITFLVTVQSPGATLTSITPATLPTANPGTTFTLNITGTGFVGGTNASLATRIGIVVNNAIVTDTNLAINVVNPSNMTLTITVPTVADANLPFSPTGSGGAVNLGIVNGNSSSIPTGTTTLTIGGGPIIQGATSSSSFIEVTPPTLPTFAPYDMITLWGSNFCSSNGTGCGSNTILVGSPDALTMRYPTTLPLPAPDATGRLVSVQFFPHGSNSGGIYAPLLFASNGQINLIVPAGVAGFGGQADIYAYFGFGSGATLLTSAASTVNIAAADPGVFTVGSDGQGAGAALDINWNLITNSNAAGMRSGGSDSDTIQIFVTGLGAPDSAGPSGTPSTPCIPATTGSGNYESLLQAQTSVNPALSSIDGAVVQTGLFPTGGLPPCFTSNTPVTVTVGGVSANVTYAGFVGDTVAGLYQVNAQLPSSVGTFYPNSPATTNPITNITAPVQLPVQVTVNSVSSQPGVTVWVAPRLSISASNLDSSGNVYATVGVTPADLTTIAATEGTGNIQYTLTSGLLPAGLTLNAATGVIGGRPAANTSGSYKVTVTATDSATTPVTGSVSVTVVVAGGLFLNSTGSAPYSTTFGTATATVTTVTATGGKFPYTYVMTFAGAGTPTGLTINANSGVISTTAATLAGAYNVTVTATDSAGTPVTGSLSFTINVALHATQAAGSGADIKVVTVTGNSGTVTYTLDAASTTAGLAIDASGNITAGSAGAATYPVTVTVNDTNTLAPGASGEGTGTVGPFNVVVP